MMDLDSQQKELLNDVFQEALAFFLTFTIGFSAIKFVAETTEIVQTDFPSYMLVVGMGFALALATLVFKGGLAIRRPESFKRNMDE